MKRKSLLFSLLSLFFALLLVGYTFYHDIVNIEGKIYSDTQALLTSNDEHGNKSFEGVKKVADNKYLSMYFDGDTSFVSILDKRTGKVWSTNPLDLDENPDIQNTNKDILKHQFVITYYNPNGQIRTIDNYKESIERGQFDYVLLEKGIKVTYTLGDMSPSIGDTPQKISNARFKSVFLDRLEEEVQKELKTYFLYSEETDSWTRFNFIDDQGVTRLLEIMDKVGYTRDELLIDASEQGFDVVDKVSHIFKVAISYTLDDNSLLVDVPLDELTGPEDYPITRLRLLEFFGAANSSQEGYVFLPDGSGALMDLEFITGSRFTQYNAIIYGIDSSVERREKLLNSEPVLMPVFGMKQGDNAFFAIVEDGDAIGNIVAYKGYQQRPYSTVFTDYNIRTVETILLGDSYTSMPTFQEELYDGSISIRYVFLNDDKANYVGMAEYYRGYLVDNYDLQRINIIKDDIPLTIETFGAVDKLKSFLGITYRGKESLTTYQENIKIVDELKGKGIQNIRLKMSGWFNGGMDYTLPNKISFERVLGGKNGFEQLVDYADTNNIELYPDTGFLRVNESGKGFWVHRDAAKTADNRVVKLYDFCRASYGIDRWKHNHHDYILSPARLPNTVFRFSRDFSSLNINNLSLRDMGSIINSDYSTRNTFDRQTAMHIIEQQAEKLSNETDKIMINTGNIYMLPYVDIITDLPNGHSYFNLANERVPFYQMVVSGYVEYTTGAVNLSSNHREILLRALETGAGLYYTLIFEDSSILKGTDYNEFYTLHYRDWLNNVIELYDIVNEALKCVYGELIVGHEKISEGLYKTDYENGFSIIVNYKNTIQYAEDIKIDAEGFKLLKGGN